MSENADERAIAKVKEFKIELEYLIAGTLLDVPIAAIKRVFGSDDMATLVAKVRRPARR